MRYLLIIKYDGTRYHGWQVQKNALAVQAVVQNALGAVLGTPPDVTGCSRTDSGVHVNMYCCHFDTDKLIPERNMILAVNRALPDDISAYGCRKVDGSFHARYSATGKQYIYRFFNSPYRDAFLERYTYRVFSHMDEALMNKAAAEMVGTYDFSSFCSVNAKEGSKVRTVSRAQVVREGQSVTFITEADGYLYNMVRIMAGTLLRVSEGKIAPGDIKGIIESKNRQLAGPTLPAKGLFLNRVFYPEFSSGFGGESIGR